jgi:hypothetical protein
MVSEVVRANFGSYPTPALGSALGRSGSSAQRFAPANDALVLDHDLIDSSQAEGRPSSRAWTARVRNDTVSLEDLLPRATFAAQLMSQEDSGTRAHLEDYAGVVAAYTTAEQRPYRAATGTTLSCEI